MNERLTMTVEDAGRLLGLSRNAAYAAAAAGTIPTIQIGRRLLVPAKAMHELLGATRAETTTVWEYLWVRVPSRADLYPLLQQHGQKGWEAWHLERGVHCCGYDAIHFKRQLTAASPPASSVSGATARATGDRHPHPPD